MRLRLDLDQEDWEVEITACRKDADGADILELRVLNAPEPFPGSILTARRVVCRGEVWALDLEGRVQDLLVRRNGSGFEISAGTRPLQVTVASPWAGRPAGSADAGDGTAQVRARMPGRVIRVLRSAGDRVSSGDGLAVIEAMKMQNELKATRSGIVQFCGIEPGQTVAGGDLLFEIG